MQKLLIGNFGLGAWEKTGLAARQPEGSVRFAQDAFVDDDGVLRVRGRLGQRNSSDLGTAFSRPWTPVFVWAGALLPGFREVFVTYSAAIPSYRFTVLNDAGTGYSVGYSIGGSNTTADFTAAAVWGNTLVMSPTDPLASLWVYGGSRRNTGVTAMSCTFTAGSTAVTTSADFIAAGVEVGSLVALPVSGFAVVKKVISTTSLTIDRPALSSGTVAGNLVGDFFLNRFGPVGAAWSGQVESIAGRAVLMQRNQLTFSDGPDPTTGGHRTYSWPAVNLHEFPNDAEGVALKALRDRLFVFTQAGNFAVSGMAQEITDGSGNPQHSIEQLTGKSVAMGQSGIVSWQGALVVPCRDGVFAIDGYGSPVLLSRGLPWAEMVRGGLKVGWATIFQGRYLLPVTYQGSTWTYVFRMDGVDTASSGTVFPTSRLLLPANPVALASSSSDKLLVLGDPTEGALEGGELFSQTTNATDYDGGCSTDLYNWRSAPLQLGVKAVIRRIRVLYTYRTPTSPNNPSLIVGIEGGNTPVNVSFRLPATAATSEPVWAAADLAQPVEVAAPILNLTLSAVPHSAFAQEFTVHAIEVQYRSFGAP